RLELEYAEVVPGRPNTAFAQNRNPLRKVPALLTDTGETIYDSTVICEYLDTLAGGDVLIPRDPVRRWRVLTNHALAPGMCESVILVRCETWFRRETLGGTVWVGPLGQDPFRARLVRSERKRAGRAGQPGPSRAGQHAGLHRFPLAGPWLAESVSACRRLVC